MKVIDIQKCPRAKHVLRFVAIGLVMLAGCATPHRQAITLNADAFNHHIPAIYVMPVIDGRSDKSAKLGNTDFNHLTEMSQNILGQLGYRTILANSWGTGAAASNQTLADMSDAELSRRAPPESQVFLVITVNDVHGTYKLITANYAITATLMAIDRQSGTEIWKDAATGYASGSGILPAALSQVNKHGNAENILLRQVFSSFPKNKQP